MSDMRSEMPVERTWTLSHDRTFVRLQLPPLQLAGVPKPPSIHLDFDTEMVDEMLQRLTVLRSQMVSAPRATSRVSEFRRNGGCRPALAYNLVNRQTWGLMCNGYRRSVMVDPIGMVELASDVWTFDARAALARASCRTTL